MTMPASTSAPAVRMRHYRKRRSRGIRIVRIHLNGADTDALISKGYLDQASRGDRDALENAITALVDDALNSEA